MNMRTPLIGLILLAGSFLPTVHAQSTQRVTQQCADLYREHGAVPRTETCFIDAATSSVGLSNFHCTGIPAQIESFCRGDLPLYDEDEDDDGSDDEEQEEDQEEGGPGGDDDEGTDDDSGSDDGSDGGSDDGGSDNEGEDSSESGADAADDGMAESTDEAADDEIETIEGDGAGNPDTEPSPLQDYDGPDDNNQGQNNGNCNNQNPLPTLPPAVDVSLALTTQFLPNTILSNYGNLSAAATLTNLTSSAVQAQETGDSSLFFSNIFALVFPLIPQDSSLGQAFQDFSAFFDGQTAGGCR